MNTAADTYGIKAIVFAVAIVVLAILLSSATGIGPWADQLAANNFFAEHESTMRQVSKVGAVNYATGG